MNNIIFTGDILRPNSKMKPIATRDVDGYIIYLRTKLKT